MEKTPLSLRTHITLFGNTNSGKSSLFNKLLGQDIAIVSPRAGTTTDPVIKAMELIPYGPVALCDTAGWGDTTEIGSMREAKTNDLLRRTDFALYVADSADFNEDAYRNACEVFEENKIEHLLIFTKSDLGKAPKVADSISVSINDESSIERLKSELIKRLERSVEKEKSVMGSLLKTGDVAILVIPIDSDAPKGRLILPQVQIIRDCLDNGITAVCVRDTELKSTIERLGHVDLVITDSQAFKKVAELVPEDIMLTSFSMLLAYQKGDIFTLSEGAKALDNLKDKSRILMAEACTNNTSHEDIGRVKIPRLLRKYTGKDLIFEYSISYDFPKDLTQYDMIIHCGGCMISKRAMESRMDEARKFGVPITNYGVVISYANGILKRSLEIFKKEKQNEKT